MASRADSWLKPFIPKIVEWIDDGLDNSEIADRLIDQYDLLNRRREAYPSYSRNNFVWTINATRKSLGKGDHESSDNKRRTHISPKQIVEVNQLLTMYLEPDGDFFKYRNGFDDLRISNQVGCAIRAVRDIRIEMFGRLQSIALSTARLSVQDVAKRLDSLEWRIAKFFEFMGYSEEESGNEEREKGIEGGDGGYARPR